MFLLPIDLREGQKRSFFKFFFFYKQCELYKRMVLGFPSREKGGGHQTSPTQLHLYRENELSTHDPQKWDKRGSNWS